MSTTVNLNGVNELVLNLPGTTSATINDGAVTLTEASTTQFGSIASLPTAVPAAGNTYICSDCGYSFVSNGSSWQAVYLGFPVTRPQASALSWVAQGSATVTSSTGTLVLTGPPTTGDQLPSQVTTPPTAPYTYTIGFQPILSGTGYYAAGLILRDSSTGNSILFAFANNNTDSLWLAIYRYNQPSTGNATFSSTPFIQQIIGIDPVFLQIHNDGTNLVYSIGSTPFDMKQVYTEANNAYVANINQIGPSVDANGTVLFAQMNVFHFEQS